MKHGLHEVIRPDVPHEKLRPLVKRHKIAAYDLDLFLPFERDNWWRQQGLHVSQHNTVPGRRRGGPFERGYARVRLINLISALMANGNLGVSGMPRRSFERSLCDLEGSQHSL